MLLPEPLWRFMGAAPCSHLQLRRSSPGPGLGHGPASQLSHLKLIVLSPVAGVLSYPTQRRPHAHTAIFLLL